MDGKDIISKRKGNPEDYTQKSDFWDRTEKKIQSDFLCRPYVLDLLGELEGQQIADIGCADGYVCRLLAERGANVTGVDNSQGLIEKAKKHEEKNPLSINYFVDSALELEKIGNKKFDKVISVLVFGHFNNEQMNKAIKKTSEILKKDGEFVLSVPHPFLYVCKPKTKWIDFKYEDINYFEDERADITLYTKDRDGFDISAQTHTIQSYINSLIDNGFSIEEVKEPKPTKKDLDTYSEMWGEETSRPSYLIIKSKKVL
ncbi:MAG: class I SAM-dependent methyltransferase [Candidatus Pacearchaeota archaeon]